MENKKCKNCIYWEKFERYSDDEDWGDCHRNPPGESTSAFPITTADTWCGEFKNG